jgi:hypothetical protein
VNDRTLGGGVGPDSGEGDRKNELLSDPTLLGGAGAEERRGVASVSSRKGCDELEEIEDERVNGGGGGGSGELENGDAKKAFVFLPFENEGEGEAIGD